MLISGSDYPSPNTNALYQSESKLVKTGKILVFVNLGYAKLDEGTRGLALGTSDVWSVDPTSGRVKIGGVAGLNMDRKDITNVRAMVSANGSWSIDENGNLAVKSITADSAKIGAVEIGSATKPTGVTVYDKITGQPVCLAVANGAPEITPGVCVPGASVPGGSGQVLGESTPPPASEPSPTPAPAPEPAPAPPPEVPPPLPTPPPPNITPPPDVIPPPPPDVTPPPVVSQVEPPPDTTPPPPDASPPPPPVEPPAPVSPTPDALPSEQPPL